MYLKRNDLQFCNRMILDGEEFRHNYSKWFWPQIETLNVFHSLLFGKISLGEMFGDVLDEMKIEILYI